MQFRQSSQHSYFNKNDQFRMLRMVGLLVLVVVCMKVASDPGMWTWLFPESTAETEDTAAAKKKIDYSVKWEEKSALAPDAFRSQSDPKQQVFSNPAVAEPAPDRSPKRKAAQTTVGDYVVEIDPSVFADVSDDWLGVRQREAPAFFAILAKSADIPLKLLENAGDDEVDYTVLMTDSEQFRGRPLSVEGTIRRIDRVTIGAKEVEKGYPLDHYFVAWIFTESSGNSPYRLVAVGIPEDMPTGEDIEVPAKFTGYFFKREGYHSEQGFHKAPVLIGKQIRWHRPAVATEQLPQDSGLAPYAIGLAVLIAVGISAMIWRFNVSDKKFGHKHVEHFITASPSAIEELQKLQTSDPNDLFRRMQEEAIAADLENGNAEMDGDQSPL